MLFDAAELFFFVFFPSIYNLCVLLFLLYFTLCGRWALDWKGTCASLLVLPLNQITISFYLSIQKKKQVQTSNIQNITLALHAIWKVHNGTGTRSASGENSFLILFLIPYTLDFDGVGSWNCSHIPSPSLFCFIFMQINRLKLSGCFCYSFLSLF